MALEWKEGRSGAFTWSKDDHRNVCAVWPGVECFVGWVTGPYIGSISRHSTEAEAKNWCETQMCVGTSDG